MKKNGPLIHKGNEVNCGLVWMGRILFIFVLLKLPTNPFTIMELQNPSHVVPELNRIRRSPDLEAQKL